MNRLRPGLKAIAEDISLEIKGKMLLGLGSGSTVAILLEELSSLLSGRGVSLSGVPTSAQIESVATRTGVSISPFTDSVDLVLDGADQVDRQLNLIKGGGGALLKEKVVMGNSRKTIVVAGQEKFATRLCEGGVRVPVEVAPIARVAARRWLSAIGGTPQERLLPKGYPYFTESGNIILDTAFEPVGNPSGLEGKIKKIPGVLEVGIFTFKPITVYRVKENGTFERLKSGK